jgi:hydantoinase/carbamoylase family amidase
MNTVEVDSGQLLENLAELAQIGADPAGGITRLAYTSADLEARNWFTEKARNAGLAISIDPIGNILAVEPSETDKAPVLSGSHLDSVPGGGRFDGALGVVVALEAVRSIRHRRGFQRRRPLGVAVLAAEESSRFGIGCLGSRVIVQDLSKVQLESLLDDQGITLFEALKRIGLDGSRWPEARRSPGWFNEFVEIHIDQANDLLRAGVPLGVITSIAAPTRLRLMVHGEQAHSGATRMHERRDALLGAAEIVLEVEATAKAHADQGIVGTVGILRIHQQSMNMVPGMVELAIDLRGINMPTLGGVVESLTEKSHKIASNRGLRLEISVLQRSQPVQVSEERVARLENACQKVGVKYLRMASRSAHDAMYMSQHGPISMLFVRNLSGVSHSPAENASPEDLVAGASVLATYMASAAQE